MRSHASAEVEPGIGGALVRCRGDLPTYVTIYESRRATRSGSSIPNQQPDERPRSWRTMNAAEVCDESLI